MALHERPVDRRSPEPPRLPEPSPACPSTGNYLDLGRGHDRDDGRTRVSRRRVDSPIQELSLPAELSSEANVAGRGTNWHPIAIPARTWQLTCVSLLARSA